MAFIDKLIESRFVYRFLESLPGLISWSLILGPLILAIYKPNIVAYFMLAYSVYWVYNSVKFVMYAFIGHRKMLYVTKQNWLSKLKKAYPKEWDKYYYCTLLPFASESINVIEPTVKSLAEANFPKEKKILCLSSEKALPQGKEVVEKIKEKYKDHFKYIFSTEHELKPGEIKGKSSNQNHGGRFLYKKIIEKGVKPEHILLTSNDSDMLNHKQYIPYLLFKFLSNGDLKHKRLYQPVPTDYEDHWKASFFSRVIITIGVQWRLALQQRNNYRSTLYSFYSLSLKTLKEINFWDVDLIPEDERTQFKALYRFGKDFKVIPLFIPAIGRPVQGSNKWASFKEQYIQIRRWAWGASEFAVAFSMAIKNKHVPWKVKIMPILNQLRTSTEWVVSSILPLFGGMIPLLLNEEFRETNLAFALPQHMQSLMIVGSFMVIIIIYIEWRIAPKLPKSVNVFNRIFYFLQWLFLPYIGLMLSSVPALDAQTRLIFNRHIQYVESKKEK
jgi:hypothetical protein